MSDTDTEERGRKPGRPSMAERVRERRERVQISGRTARLGLESRKGHERRWVRGDLPGRIESFQERDWTFVLDAEGQKIARRTGVAADGTVQLSYAMEIPTEFYQDDQKRKAEPLDEFDAALKRGSIDPNRGNPDGDGLLYGRNSSLKRD